jgi:hypothetical protein
VWRKLKSLGAVYLQGSAATLPAGDDAERALRRLRHEIVDINVALVGYTCKPLVIAAVGTARNTATNRTDEENHESETGHDVADLRGHRGCDLGFGYLDGHRGDRRTHLASSTQDASAIAVGPPA